MHKVLLIGNPNVGKSTLFNSLTKSHEHTGNFHGVTVEEKRKRITFAGEQYEFVDLPGIYSLNTFSFEEDVSKNILLKEASTKLLICDANSLRRNLYISLQMNELGLGHKILINNYEYFLRHGGKIDAKKLEQNLGVRVEIINAKKIKLSNNILNIYVDNSTKMPIVGNSAKEQKIFTNQKNDAIYSKNLQNNGENLKISKTFNKNTSYLTKFIKIVESKFDLSNEQIVFAFNGEFQNLEEGQIEFIRALYPQIIKARYDFLDAVLFDCVSVKKDFVYGASKLDKFLLNPIFMFVAFLLFFFLSIYVIFFGVGPLISEFLISVLNFVLINPVLNLLGLITNNMWLIEFFSGGVFNSFTIVLSFLPQVCLLFIFITILEDSGLISRLAYVFDDFLSFFGLNGKSIYIILLGLGCNTMSTLASRNASNKNLKIKTALVNPYISCMARLPIFVLVASAFFGAKSYFVVVGLYLLGLFVALAMSCFLNKTLLKNTESNLLLEFPPVRGLDFKHIFQVGKSNAVDFTKRVFGVVVSVGIIVWLLSHTSFSLAYTSTITNSILFFFADKISFVFAPIGLNSAGVVCALIVGIMAKELIVSTISISNNALTNSTLMLSLTMASSAVHFNTASALSFLIFSLLYCPCISNLAVLKKEVGKFYMWFAIISQFTIAYLLSFMAYQGITHGIIYPIIALVVAAIILFSAAYIIKKVKHPKCLTCNRCGKK